MNVFLGIFDRPQKRCVECSIAATGVCNLNGTDVCQCFTEYTGDFCREKSATLGTVSSSTFWTVIVAIVSAIAGILLITSIVLCACFIIKRRRTKALTKDAQPNDRQDFHIPRAHMPTLATRGLRLDDWDGFSLDQTDEGQNRDSLDTTDSSSTTTYNATYRTNATHPEADFGIFDALERQIPMAKGHIPRPQMDDMLGTLNSLPSPDPLEETLAGNVNRFSDSRDLNEIELVTDMLDDMTRDDILDDDFIEALNPNLAIPRTALEPERKSSSWFPVKISLFFFFFVFIVD